MRIFLSYGHDEHIELAMRIKADLEARGHEVWFDRDRIMPGSDYECYIEEGLNWCAALPENSRMVLLMTPHSVRRPDGYCLNEITAAINRNITIIPVMVIDCSPPLSICRIQWLDMTDCVPLAKQGERYELKLGRLIEALEKGMIDFEGAHSYLHHHLKPLDFFADLAKHVPQFTGRKWVFDRIDAWLANPTGSKVFWITGPPGIGKTAIVAYLCHKYREVAAFHLCQHGHDDRSDPRRCVMSLAYQVSSQLPDYQQSLAAMDLSEEARKSPATLFDNLFIQPLVPPFPEPDQSILLVIDALDEATQNGKNYLAEFIAEAFLRTPHWLRLVITSRPDPEVVQPLQGLSPYYLDASSPDNLKDIRTYLRYHLSSCSPQQTPDEQLIDTLLGKSEGIFLYVERVLADLREGKLTFDRVNELPPGLGGSFFQFFARQFPDITRYQQKHRPLLGMIIAAKGPMPLELAQTALKWDKYVLQEALMQLGSLFLRIGGQIQPFHQSIADWLTNPDLAGSYFVDIYEGRRRLVDACWSEYQAGVDGMSTYSLALLPKHLMELGRWNDLLDLVTCPKLSLIAKWIEEGEGDKNLTCLTGLIKFLEKENRHRVTSAGLATQVARIHSLRGEYDDAEYWLKHALSLTAWRHGRRAKAVAFHELGSLRLYQGDLSQASRLYRKALRLCLWGIPAYHDEAAANQIGLGTVSLANYFFLNTIRFTNGAIREAKKAGDIRHVIAGKRLMGTAYKYLGRYAEAKLHIHEAIFLCDKFEIHLEKGRLLLLWAWLQYDVATLKKEFPVEAKECFQKAMEDSQRVHNMYCLLEAMMGLGWCALAEKATSEAENWFELLKKFLVTQRHPELRAGVEIGLAALFHQQGDLQAAEELYMDSISLCSREGVLSWNCKATVGLGAVYWHLAKLEKAETTWKQSLQLANRISLAKRSLTEISIELCRSDLHQTP